MRLFRHIFTGRATLRAKFRRSDLQAIEAAIREAETATSAQIRVAIESSLSLTRLIKGTTARTRALEIFRDLMVWDTEQNNGVLIYILQADRDAEILCDRAAFRSVSASLPEVVQILETEFAAGRGTIGIISAITKLSLFLAKDFPANPAGTNELPDAVELL